MIKRRLSLALSLLWRTYVVFFLYSIAFTLVIGLPFGRLVLANRNVILYTPAVALLVFALLLAILEMGLRINLLRAIFGARLKRSPAQWRTSVLHLSALMAALAAVNALVTFSGSADAWMYYRTYPGPLLFFVGVFAIGWAQATSDVKETGTALVEH